VKSPLSRALSILAGVVAGILIWSVIYASTGFTMFSGARENPTSTPHLSNAELTALSYRVLNYIKAGDYEALSRLVHPELGVVFSPYATVALTTNQCFLPGQVASFGTDTQLYVWGLYADSREPIELTPAGYFAQFVFDNDYTNATMIGVNHVVRRGNALENMTEVFQDVRFVDFHIPGRGIAGFEHYEWRSLRLGFEEYNGSLWLSVILHSQWMV